MGPACLFVVVLLSFQYVWPICLITYQYLCLFSLLRLFLFFTVFDLSCFDDNALLGNYPSIVKYLQFLWPWLFYTVVDCLLWPLPGQSNLQYIELICQIIDESVDQILLLKAHLRVLRCLCLYSLKLGVLTLWYREFIYIIVVFIYIV